MPLAPPLRLRKPLPAPPPLSQAHIPAPIGGLNTVDPGYQLPDLDCPFLSNLIGAENGLRSRLGYKEWCLAVGSGVVPTVMPFHGSSSNGSKDRLFATSSADIYDVSASSATPSSKLTFASSAGDAGWGISHGSVNSAGAHFLLYTDEQNGYHVYTESSDTWAKIAMGAGATQIAGVDPALFCFVTVWKNFVLFVEKDSTRMWFSSTTNAPYGTVTSWDFGAQFKHGGNLVGLWNWSIEGGNGIDTFLVAISSSGDVVVYQGTDPNGATTFGIVNMWFVGGVPKGRRIASDYGGDLLILSSVGVIPMSKLVNGVAIADRSQYSTYKIGNLFNRAVSTYGTIKGWSLRIHPEDATLLITVPVADGQPTTQLAMSLLTRGWAQYRSLPMLSNEAWGGKLYFGTADGRVCVNTDYLDNVNLAATTYTQIQFSGISAFRNLGNGRQKQAQIVRATVISEGLFSIATQARYRYDLTEATPPGIVPSNASDVWDTGLWDTAKWGGGFATGQTPQGAAGMGPDVAIAFAGAVAARTVIVGFDVVFTVGGFL